MIKFFIVFIISISTYISAKETKFEKRLQKDIKKLSRISGFIDNELKLYDEKTILEKKIQLLLFTIMAHMYLKREEKSVLKALEESLKQYQVYIIKK